MSTGTTQTTELLPFAIVAPTGYSLGKTYFRVGVKDPSVGQDIDFKGNAGSLLLTPDGEITQAAKSINSIASYNNFSALISDNKVRMAEYSNDKKTMSFYNSDRVNIVDGNEDHINIGMLNTCFSVKSGIEQNLGSVFKYQSNALGEVYNTCSFRAELNAFGATATIPLIGRINTDSKQFSTASKEIIIGVDIYSSWFINFLRAYTAANTAAMTLFKIIYASVQTAPAQKAAASTGGVTSATPDEVRTKIDELHKKYEAVKTTITVLQACGQIISAAMAVLARNTKTNPLAPQIKIDPLGVQLCCGGNTISVDHLGISLRSRTSKVTIDPLRAVMSGPSAEVQAPFLSLKGGTVKVGGTLVNIGL